MKINLTKQLKLTLIYFTTVFAVFFLFTIFIISNYHNQIYGINDRISEIALDSENNPYENNSQEYLEKPTFKFSNQKLGIVEFDSVGFKKESLYEISSTEIKNKIGNEVIYLEPYDQDVTGINIPNNIVYPSISMTEITTIQNDIYHNLLKSIFSIFTLIIFVFGLIAHFLSKKTLMPLENSLRKQKEFVSDASHEIKTPITLIKLEAEVLLRNNKSSLGDYMSFAKNTVEDINRLDGLTSNLLRLAQLDQNSNEIIHAKEKIFIKKSFTDVSIKMASIAQEKKIHIKNSINNEISILANKQDIIQVFNILLDNAIKYGEEKSDIIISATSESKYIDISIQNIGETIPKNDIPHIFNRFYRVSKDRNKSGYGLGLAIAREIILKQKGIIKIKSENSKTKVYLRLYK